jgi:hypothetical protein
MHHMSMQQHRQPIFGAPRHAPQDFVPTHASARHDDAANVRSLAHHEQPVSRSINTADAWRSHKSVEHEQRHRSHMHGQLYAANIRSRSGRAKYIESMKEAKVRLAHHTEARPALTSTMPQAKRKTARARIPQACNACRLHKRRCSGHLPCELCTKRGRATWCTYEDPEDEDDDEEGAGEMDFEQVSSQFIRDARRRSYSPASPPSSPLEPADDSRTRAPQYSQRKTHKRRGSAGSSDDSLGGSSDDDDFASHKPNSAGSSEPSSSAMSRTVTLDDAAVANIVQPLRRSPSDGHVGGSGMAALSLSATLNYNKDSGARAGPPRIRAASSGESGFFRGPLGDSRPRFRFGFLSGSKSPQFEERLVLAGPPPTSLGLSKIIWTYGRKLPTPLPLTSPVPTTPRGPGQSFASARHDADNLMSPPLPVDPELVSCVLVDSSGRPRLSRADLEVGWPGLFNAQQEMSPTEAARPLTAPISSSLSTFLPAAQGARPSSAGKDLAAELEVIEDDVAMSTTSPSRAPRSASMVRSSNLQLSPPVSAPVHTVHGGGVTRLHLNTATRPSLVASPEEDMACPPLPSMLHLSSSHEQAIASAQYDVLCRGQGLPSASAVTKTSPKHETMPAPSRFKTKDSRRASHGRRSRSSTVAYVPSQPALQTAIHGTQNQQQRQHEAMAAWHEERSAHKSSSATRLRNHSQPVRPSETFSMLPAQQHELTSTVHEATLSPRKRKLDSSASDGAHHSPTKPHAGCGSPSSRQPTSVFTPLPGSRDGAAAGMVQFAPTAPHHAGQRQHDGSVHESAGTH